MVQTKGRWRNNSIMAALVIALALALVNFMPPMVLAQEGTPGAEATPEILITPEPSAASAATPGPNQPASIFSDSFLELDLNP